MGTSRFSSLAGRLPSSASNPTNPLVGDEYYNTVSNSWMRWDGANWVGVVMLPNNTTTSTTTTSTTTTTTSTTTTSTSSSTTTTSSSTSTSTTV